MWVKERYTSLQYKIYTSQSLNILGTCVHINTEYKVSISGQDCCPRTTKMTSTMHGKQRIKHNCMGSLIDKPNEPKTDSALRFDVTYLSKWWCKWIICRTMYGAGRCHRNNPWRINRLRFSHSRIEISAHIWCWHRRHAIIQSYEERINALLLIEQTVITTTILKHFDETNVWKY